MNYANSYLDYTIGTNAGKRSYFNRAKQIKQAKYPRPAVLNSKLPTLLEFARAMAASAPPAQPPTPKPPVFKPELVGYIDHEHNFYSIEQHNLMLHKQGFEPVFRFV